MDLLDIEELNTLSHETILDLLMRRYMKDEIYTWASRTLVAINPYKQLDSRYCQQTQQQLCGSDKPHVYSIAENAVSIVQQPYTECTDASIIVSGESGSGKTESTKHLLRYLTVLTSEVSSQHQHASHIEQHILAVNPVLEAFGNARTSCNDNSSRFGKYIVLQYNSSHRLVGAHIQAYLLEKTRVVYQGFGNSNFHIFYQFLFELAETEREKYLVPGCDVYNFAQSNQYDGKAQNWTNTVSALRNVGFTEDNLHQIYSTIGAVLCLGNVLFTQSSADDVVDVDDTCHIYTTKCSSLLGIDYKSLHKLLLYRCISASHARRKSVFYKPCTLSEAKSRRDCIAKVLYDRLFCWLVREINQSIECTEYSSFIGLLDIYGFECFQVNSLEQLCINYANERLQHYFIQHYLHDLQAEYEQERISWHYVSVPANNISCVQLLSGTNGVFSLLNEECQLNRLKLEENIAERFLTNSISAHPNIKCTRKDVMNKCFTICHYAGSVSYSTGSLVEKNKDLLPADIIDALAGSSHSYICDMVSGLKSTDIPKQQKKTVLSRFKNSLDELLDMLRRTECQYIRCIKPNREAKPGSLDTLYVDRQLKACGVMETVKIRSQAHAFRFKYEDFLSTYQVLNSQSSSISCDDKENKPHITPRSARQRRRTLLPSAELNRSVDDTLNSGNQTQPFTPVKKSMGRTRCTNLLLSVIGPSMNSLVAFGATKLFIKSHNVMELLESARLKKLGSFAFTIQCAWRRVQRRKYRLLLERSAAVISRAMRRMVQAMRAERLKEVPVIEFPSRGQPQAFVEEVIGGSIDLEVERTVTHLADDSIVNTFTNGRIVFRKCGLVSIRRVSDTKLAKRFHVRASSLLKNSHIPSVYDHPGCCLTDCLEQPIIR